MTPDVSTQPPDGYAWPGADAVADAGNRPLYWLREQPDRPGAGTTLWMLVAALPDGQHILAERMYEAHAVWLVDVLRAAAAPPGPAIRGRAAYAGGVHLAPLAGTGPDGFSALLFAALLVGEGDDLSRLRAAFPAAWRELRARRQTPNGRLPGETS